MKLAFTFDPREYFTLMVLAFITVLAAYGDSTIKGLTSVFAGRALAISRGD